MTQSGTKTLGFAVALSNPSSQPVTVQYATANGIATAGSDYSGTSGTLTIPANQTTATIGVPLLGDTTYEPNETFTLTLSNPRGSTLGDPQAVGTIENDDRVAPPYGATYQASDFSLAPGASTTVPVTVSNTGSLTWGANSAFRLAYHWYQGDRLVEWDGERTALPSPVAPAGSLPLQAAVRAPSAPGTYTLKWDVVREGVTWFSWQGVATKDVTVAVDNAGSGAFLPVDLNGTWSLFTRSDRTNGANDPGWTQGTFAVNNGVIAGGTLNDSWGTPETITGGSMSITTLGKVRASATTSDGTFILFSDAQMDPSKGLMFGVTTLRGPTETRAEFGMAVKQSGNFTSTDLNGTWSIFTLSDRIGGTNDPGWSRGTITVSNGVITSGSMNDSWGTPETIASGFVSITNKGTVTGSATSSDGTYTLFKDVLMDPSKGLMVGVNTLTLATETRVGLRIAVRQSGNFAPADLSDTWSLFVLSDRKNGANSPGWDQGTFTVNNGVIISGSTNDSWETPETITSGSVGITSIGTVTGSATSSSGTYTLFTDAQMDHGKRLMVGVTTLTLPTEIRVELGLAVRI